MPRKLHDYESVKTLKTPSVFRKAEARNAADQSKLCTKFIDTGRGHWRNAEMEAAAKAGDPDAILQIDLYIEARALGSHAREWFGMEPFLV